MRYRYWIVIGAGIILGIIFIAAALGKLLNQAEFLAIIVPNRFLSLTQANFIAHWLPWAELILGLLLIAGIATEPAAAVSSVLIAGFIANNSWMISQGLGYKPCGCLSIVERMTQTQLSTIGALYLDIGMLAIALVILFCYKGSFFNIYPWFLARGKIAGKKNRVGSGWWCS